jgi:regulator of sigma D
MNRTHKSVSDLGAAAYILMHRFKVIGRKGKDIYFSLNEKQTSEEFDQLVLDYLSSEYHRFDSCIMSLKKIGEYSFEAKNNKFVADLGAAAYVLMHKYKVIGKKGKCIYFEVDNDQETRDRFDDLALDYISSDFHRFDSCLMSLKKIGEYVSDH